MAVSEVNLGKRKGRGRGGEWEMGGRGGEGSGRWEGGEGRGGIQYIRLAEASRSRGGEESSWVHIVHVVM